MKCVTFFGLLLAGASLAPAVETGVLTDEGYAQFFRGELKNLSLSQQGEVEAAPKLTEVARLQQPVVWTAVPDRQGNLILGTGNQGEVVRLLPDGSTEVLFAPDVVLSRALAVAPDGSIFVGTSPDGAIYRLRPDGGKPEVFLDLRDTYLWSLTLEDGALWAVTGLNARFLKIPLSDDFSEASEPEVWLETGDDHLTTLLRDGDRWLVGASGKGIVYAVTAPGEAYALSHVDQSEIRALAAGADGSVLFSAYDESAPGSGGSRPSGPNDLSPMVVTAAGGGAGDTPSGSGTGYLYRIEPDGFTRSLWRSTRAGLFSLAQLNEQYWLGGSNDAGKLFYFADRHDWGLLHQLPKGGDVSVVVPVPEGSGFYVISSNPGVVYRLGGLSEEPSRFTSRVLDARQPVRWGGFELTLAAGGDYSVSTRSGNTADPDDTWSPWLALEEGRIASRTGRFLQYRVEIPGESAARFLRARVFYELSNVAPQIAALRVLGFGAEIESLQTNGQTLDFAAAFRDGPLSQFEGGDERLKLIRRGEHSFRTVVWQASDPNGDALSFEVALRKVDTTAWTTLASDLREPAYLLNIVGLTPGHYQVRLIASDHRGNPADSALTDTRVSELVLFDSTPPTIEKLPDESGPERLVLAVNSDVSRLVAAQITIGGGEARRLRPRDGFFDQARESFVVELPSDLEPGTSILFEVLDESRNQAVYTENLEGAASR